MNRAYQSWSPRARPLEPYSSLLGEFGCRDVFGVDVGGFYAFEQSCAFNHTNATDSVFNQSDTISYTIGPENIGDLPYRTLQGSQFSARSSWGTSWVAWSDGTGVRIARDSHVTPPDPSSGSSSTLYPTTDPSKLSLGFTAGGQVSIAIQKDASTIEVKWTRVDGSTVSTASWTGVSAVLFNSALLNHFQLPRLACYYLKTDAKGSLFIRLESEDFGTEYVVHEDLQDGLSRLIQVLSEGGRAYIYGRTSFESGDVTLTSKLYSLHWSDGMRFVPAFVSVTATTARPKITPSADLEAMGVAFVSVTVDSPVVEPAAFTGDSTVMGVSFLSISVQ